MMISCALRKYAGQYDCSNELRKGNTKTNYSKRLTIQLENKLILAICDEFSAIFVYMTKLYVTYRNYTEDFGNATSLIPGFFLQFQKR